MSKSDELIRDYLLKIGAPKSMVNGGLSYFLKKWEKVVLKLEDPGSYIIIDEYLEWLDSRGILEEIRAFLEGDRRTEADSIISNLDRRFMNATVFSADCLWGKQNEKEYGYNPRSTWWYYREPKLEVHGRGTAREKGDA